MDWGAALRRATRKSEVEALGPRRSAGAPLPRASEVGADWTKDLGFAGPLAKAVAFVDCFVGALKLGDGAAAASGAHPPAGQSHAGPCFDCSARALPRQNHSRRDRSQLNFRGLR